jgi:hypothetical protein
MGLESVTGGHDGGRGDGASKVGQTAGENTFVEGSGPRGRPGLSQDPAGIWATYSRKPATLLFRIVRMTQWRAW